MDELIHYGTERHSGRYPWGSGDNPYQSSRDFLSILEGHRKEGRSETEIAKILGMNTTELRAEIAWANQARKEGLKAQISDLNSQGMSRSEIAKETGVSLSSVNNYLKNDVRANQLQSTTNQLISQVDQHKYIDVGAGSEIEMGISKHKMKAAINKLEQEGYYIHEIYVKRLDDPSKWTTIKVLTKEPDVDVVKQNQDQIRNPEGWTEDGGLSFLNVKPAKSVDSSRLEIKYAEDGGADKDGVIELRRGVDDLSLGNSKYAQVRIKVDDTHYLKGMAMYSDDLPDGIDIRFNTNKSKEVSKMDTLKPLKQNSDNEFGATISRQQGAINIVNEEGDWNSWKATLSAQFLSKQPVSLVKDRLTATRDKITNDLLEIQSLTNPLVKKHLLESYSTDVASKMRHLKVLGLPRTKGHVILPFPEMKANEVYAPNYRDGENLVLVRYPHGGTFEIPELKVNNKGPAKNIIGNAIDAIGIHPSVAHKLSGADFDGDTVYVIPNNNKQIKSTRSLKELENFDPMMYHNPNVPVINSRYQQTQMGVVSNLITDMTIKGASNSEIARAVKHSMVVIDAKKHKLDYRESARKNAITALQKKYQTYVSKVDGKEHTAASTIISRSKQKVPVEVQITKNGKVQTITKKVPIMDTINSARDLSSGTTVENLYADYADQLRKLSQTAAKEAARIKPIKKNNDAAAQYKPEVESLSTKLKTALSNAPKERQAQILANKTYYKYQNPDMTPDEKNKLKAQAIAGARSQTGSNRKDRLIKITPKEWEAIQSGAVSNNMLDSILKNTDMEQVKKYATPKTKTSISSGKLSRASSMLKNGATYAEVADAIGVSVSTLRDNLE